MDEPLIFHTVPSEDTWIFTGSWLLSDCESFVIGHHAADDDEDEWTERWEFK